MKARITPDLAEFIGILIGDGSVNFYPHLRQYRVLISSNLDTDHEYVTKRIVPLIKKLWGKNPGLHMRENITTIHCKFYSKPIVTWLIQFGFPLKDKIKNIDIPKRILKKRNLIKNCIRGIFDTDGSIFKKYGSYAQIGFRAYSPYLLRSLAKYLRKFGFTPSISEKEHYLFIHRQTEIKKFFKEIGSSNPKHIIRYLHWKRFGYVPRISEFNKNRKYTKELPFFDE